MTEKEIINTLRMAISEVEWKYPLDYTVALEEAIKIIRLQIKRPLKELRDPAPIEVRNIYAACPNCDELKQLRKESKWIPVTWREATENDTSYLDEYPIVLTCPMPDDRQEILISDHGYVCTDVCQIDNQGYWLEGKGDWLDIDAWMPLPKPYKAEDSDFD